MWILNRQTKCCRINLSCAGRWCRCVVFQAPEALIHMRARGQHNKAVPHFSWNICSQDGWREGKESLSLFTLFLHPFICLLILRTSWEGRKSWKSDRYLSMWSPESHFSPSGMLNRSCKIFTQHIKCIVLDYTRKCKRFSNETSEDNVNAFILIHQVRLERIP